MGKLVMAYWDCPFCGSQGIRGDVMTCPSCGRARGDVKFYMKDHMEGETREQGDTADIEYVDEEKAKYINRNPDWYCSFCNSLNSDNAQFCSNCGASRESSESNYFDMLKKKEAQEANRAEGPKPVQAQTQAQAAPRSKRPLILLLVVIAALVLLFTYMNGNKTSGDLNVSALNWQRDIQIEENIQYSESGWNLPDTAELTEEKTELHHFDSVLDHYEDVEVQRSRRVIDHYETYYTYNDLGNGMYEQEEHERPVYETEYYTETVQSRCMCRFPATPSSITTPSGGGRRPGWPPPPARITTPPGRSLSSGKMSAQATGPRPTTSRFRTSSSNPPFTGWLKATG